MNTSAKLSKKNILSDPPAAYIVLYGDTQTTELAQLEQLWQQLNTIQQEQHSHQLETKKLSRQIGEAKRNNTDIEPLKQSMQKIGQQLNQLKQQALPLEEKILRFFTASEDLVTSTPVDNTSNDNKAAVTEPRSYSDSTPDLNDITITQLTSEQPQWNDYVSKHPAGCIHHLSDWMPIFEDSYQHECLYLLAHNKQNDIVGLLPLVHLNSRLFGNLLVSMPFFQRAGAIADHQSIEEKLIQEASQLAGKSGIEHIEYRDDIPREGMPVQTHKVNMVLSLPDSKESLWQGFSAKLRAQIKRPQRENLQVTFGHIELLDDFYAVYARNMRDLGSPLHAKHFIKNILQAFPDNSWLVIIKSGQKPVAAAFLLGYKNTMEIPLASTIRAVNHMSVNMLLYWQVLKFAISHRYTTFDFGRSSKDAGTYRFKKQWGAKAKPLYWHYWLNKEQNKDAALPGLNPSNPKYALVIFLWKRLPVTISRWLGPHIVKNIP